MNDCKQVINCNCQRKSSMDKRRSSAKLIDNKANEVKIPEITNKTPN